MRHSHRRATPDRAEQEAREARLEGLGKNVPDLRKIQLLLRLLRLKNLKK